MKARELLLDMLENRKYGHTAAVQILLALPPYLDTDTRTRIMRVLEGSFQNDFVINNLSRVAPQLNPPNGAAFSRNILVQLMNDETVSVVSYRALNGGHPIESITMAIPEAKHVAEMLAHPGAVGEMREALLKRFEELVLYGGQHVFLTVEPEEESSDTAVSEELGGLTHRRSPEESQRNTPEPPPRKFRTIYDAQVWIQQNWPEFNLDETPEVEWPRWK